MDQKIKHSIAMLLRIENYVKVIEHTITVAQLLQWVSSKRRVSKMDRIMD